ncbi:ribosome biogenesis factor YjgA [Methylotenera sp.]|uniref:ribosome biogenesis factor YjgA n=1 Tax=Methylotenera sp. TaxID=2051956 RepID=UPI0027170ACA|nr:ribosome biogenesis factor YjgA [Methylotenera sp.]MDO9206216.1 ribosome biogenesis factor YjgA [Methylotenera sp.]MDP1523762.1 ribosome biogenesis factor YjgA [Methylotenera sp.]MDP2230213.1 ribosome biogenesis factor YjgA [Methylotenera sp.]MDP3142083.1 ribosome biogenesis factor YjgA [Methylotenera sp.]MDP3308794.1 ribosome biogenesis factor YjgA [Methylotenera sp.]
MKPQITAKPKKTIKDSELNYEVGSSADEPISKTKLKAEADAQQALGVRLSELPKDKLLKLDLPDAVITAVLDTKKITANGAIRRHRQYLGRLMRDIDNAPILEQLARWDGKHTAENAYFHGLERWRDRMIADNNVLSEFIALYPQVDIQQLRTLVRNAQKELEANKPPKSSRELFKLLREITNPQQPEEQSDF